MKLPSRWKEYLVLVLVVVAVYGQTIGFDFVNYDDPYLVYDNQEFLSQPSNIFTSFAVHVFTTRDPSTLKRVPYYRPMLLVCLIAEYHVWHLSPSGYHLFNVLVHIIVTFLVFWLLGKLTQNKIASWLATLLFAVHPIQTETVAWVAGLNDLLLGLFIMIMLISYVRYRQSHESKKLFFVLTILFFTFALFTKESAAFYLLLLPVYDLRVDNSLLPSFRSLKYWMKFMPMIVIIIAYVIVREIVFGVFIGAGKLYDVANLNDRIIQLPATIATHCWFIIFPNKLSVIHQANDIFWFHQPWLWLALIFPMLILLAIWRTWRSDRIASFGILWFSIGLLPLLNLIPLPIPILEHRLYVPMAGLALATTRILTATALPRISLNVKNAIAIIIIFAYAIASYVHLPVWHDSVSLWNDAIAKSPSSTKAYKNLAGYYFNLNQYDKSIDLIQRELNIAPDDRFMHTQLGRAYMYSGKFDSAADVFRRLIMLNENDLELYLEAGNFFSDLNVYDSALVYYSRGLRCDSNSYKLHYYVGITYDRLGNRPYAEDHYLRSTEINPQYAPPYFALGDLYARAGQTEAAIQNLEDGMKIGTAPMESIRLLILLYTQSGRTSEANALAQRFGI